MRRAAVLGAAVALAGCGGGTAPLTPARYRAELRHGAVVGHLTFVGAHKTVPVCKGIDQATVDRCPGWYGGSSLPGQGGVIYVAGHRRTHGGPFLPVGRLRRRDRVVFTTPYADATYVVSGRRRVPESERSILGPDNVTQEELRLQTSTIPRATSGSSCSCTCGTWRLTRRRSSAGASRRRP